MMENLTKVELVSIVNSNYYQNGWISVKDHLPRKNIEVLCYQPSKKWTSGTNTNQRVLMGRLFHLEPVERTGYIDKFLLGDKHCDLFRGGTFWAFPYICHQNFVTYWMFQPSFPIQEVTNEHG